MDEINPYAPPKSDDTRPEPAAVGEAPAYKLYTPGQIFLATFLGTPATGLYLLSANRRRIGHAGIATATLLVGIGATLLLLVLAVVLPDSIGRAASLGLTFVVWQYARADQPLLDTHLARGGKQESSWKAVGLGLAGLVTVLGLLFAYVLVTGVE